MASYSAARWESITPSPIWVTHCTMNWPVVTTPLDTFWRLKDSRARCSKGPFWKAEAVGKDCFAVRGYWTAFSFSKVHIQRLARSGVQRHPTTPVLLQHTSICLHLLGTETHVPFPSSDGWPPSEEWWMVNAKFSTEKPRGIIRWLWVNQEMVQAHK